MTEKKYTTYEQTMDKETTGKDTRSEHEWFLYYLLWVSPPRRISGFYNMACGHGQNWKSYRRRGGG